MRAPRLVAVALAALALAPAAARAQQDDPSLIERFIRNRIQKLIEGKVRPGATVRLGRLTGNWLSQLSMDSLEIRDERDSVVFRSGPVNARYDASDLVAGRWVFDELTIERPVLLLHQRVDKTWNWEHVFVKSPGPATPAPQVRASVLRLRGGTVRIQLPWTPEPWYTPRVRDSIVAARLKAGTMANTADGIVAVYRFAGLGADARAFDASAPGRDGGSVNLVDVDADANFLPWPLRQLRGTVRWFRDSVQVAVGGVQAGRSRGSASGVAHLDRRGGPPRLDFRVKVDSLALADLAWISPVVPTDGGGRATLTIRTDAADPRLVHYALADADLRTGGSRLTGGVTFGVGQPLLRITDVALTLDPLGTKEVENFLGFPLPLGLTGAFKGTVRASGGPFDKFVLDQAQATYTDTRAPRTAVPLRATGTFDLTTPGKTGFTKLVVEAPRLEAPFIAALAPKAGLPRGVAAFSATLDAKGDSLWVSALKATYDRPKVGQSVVTGRVALHRGAKGVDGYDARLRTDSLRISAAVREADVLRVGALAGTLSARGDYEAVRVQADLGGPAGRVTADVTTHVAPGRVIKGTVAVHDVVVRLASGGVPIVADAHAAVDLAGDSTSALTGTVALDVDSTLIGAARLTAGTVHLAFGDGRARIDSLAVDAGAFRILGRGGLGLRKGAADTVRLAVLAENLDRLRTELRPLFGRRRPADSSAFTAFLWDDTVRGALAATLDAAGRADSAHATVNASVRALKLALVRTDSARATAALRLWRDTLSGQVDLTVARAQVARQQLDRASAHADLLGGGRYQLAWDASAGKGFDQIGGHALAELRGDTTLVTLDSLQAHFGADTVRLLQPARALVAPGITRLDSTLVSLGKGGRLFAIGRLTDSAEATGVLSLDDFPLVVQDSATQVPPRATALLNARVELRGTRRAPRFEALLDAADVKLYGTAVGAARLTGEYRDRRLTTTASLDEGTDGQIAFAGDLPVDLSLVTVEKRFLNEPVVGTLRSDSLKLGFLKRVVPQLSEAGGTLRAEVTLNGRPERVLLDGRVTLDSGQFASREAGAQLRDLVARIALRNDSIVVEQLRARGERRPGDSVVVSGYAFLPDTGTGALDLRVRANQYAAFRSRAFGQFDLNGEVRLHGTRDAATLDGDAEVYDAVGYIGAKFVKPVEESRLLLDEGDEADSTFAPPPRVPSFAERLRERVTIGDLSLRLGDNVRLKSPDASVTLGGAIRASGRLDAVNLGGDLLAKRGIYRLNLGLATRTFQVDSGRVTFFGPLENSPALDITTTYLVRLENRDQVRIHAQILGTAELPRIVLSSDDQATTGASDTELLSYLIFGVPSFALSGQNASALRSVQNALAPTLGGVAERALSSVLPGVDMLRVTMATQNDVTSDGGSLFGASSITAGQQLGDRVFVSVNTGLGKRSACSDSGDLTPWIGLAIEYRLGPASWLQASMDPGSTSCSRSSDAAAVTQFGVDLFREFRFR